MDPSHGYSSPVYDFIRRRGENLPLPLDNDHAHTLVDFGDLLEEKELLHYVVGNRPLETDSLLEAGVKYMTPEYVAGDESPYSKLRARCIYSRNHGSGERHTLIKFYLGNLKGHVVWIFLHAYDNESSQRGEIIRCTTLDAKSMSKAFFDFRHWEEEKIGRKVLHGLKSNMELELQQKRDMLSAFEVVYAGVNDAVQLELAASVPRPRD